jgi:protein-L-isoaspartate(D-aspartate) O-methyltransferase
MARTTETREEPVDQHAIDAIARGAEPFDGIEEVDLEPLLERIGDARVVLMGEATHGTSEFYRMRARITRELVERAGFSIVALEADWPDAAVYNTFAQGGELDEESERPFQRFPQWMWRNREVYDFLTWMRQHNEAQDDSDERVGLYGLDLYSMYTSIGAVLDYLEDVDEEVAELARKRYGCLEGFGEDPARYGGSVVRGRYESCADDVVAMLRELLDRRLDYMVEDGDRFLDALQNARLVVDAERYYRTMYYAGESSWNLRDQHMFDTLETLLGFHGPDSKAIVWEHNSHVGNAAATQMSERGEHNIGQLSREKWGDDAYLIGFGTDHGTVAAASHWDGPMEIKQVRPSRADSYESLCHRTDIDRMLLPLREPHDESLRPALTPRRLERAIGVIYRPQTERVSHYFYSELPEQFDEWIWFDETREVESFATGETEGISETFPFGV